MHETMRIEVYSLTLPHCVLVCKFTCSSPGWYVIVVARKHDLAKIPAFQGSGRILQCRYVDSTHFSAHPPL